MICFLETLVLRFALLPYYRRLVHILWGLSSSWHCFSLRRMIFARYIIELPFPQMIFGDSQQVFLGQSRHWTFIITISEQSLIASLILSLLSKVKLPALSLAFGWHIYLIIAHFGFCINIWLSEFLFLTVPWTSKSVILWWVLKSYYRGFILCTFYNLFILLLSHVTHVVLKVGQLIVKIKGSFFEIFWRIWRTGATFQTFF